ncbi:mannosyltransferase [Coemansia sp. BCRC 34301]|nr:mannosyltransferase [Coemansia sp. BCRC 34301]
MKSKSGGGGGKTRQRKGERDKHVPAATAKEEGKRVAILVLGDIGRSPRMQYHALSLAKAGLAVDLIGYAGSTPMEGICACPTISIRHLPQLPWSAPRTIFYLYAVLKVLHQVVVLFWVILATITRPDFILVQNPPAIPTLLVARTCAMITGARLIIDWHNYGYTILGMRLGSEHPVVSLARRFERFFGKSAYAHLCVTDAMASDLRDKWRISGRLIVLHDKAPRHFRRLDAEEIHKLWTRLLADPQFAQLQLHAGGRHGAAYSLLTRRRRDGAVEVRRDRPMLVVSSTSWTADEDFSILLEALALYDKAAIVVQMPRLVVLITGKGSLRGFYESEIARLQLGSVSIVTAWLSAEDYPLLLGSADLGISLHTSSSGLDLPMKVVDMLGCGTPVCAYKFSCIDELVTSDNGLVFSSGPELAQQLQDLATHLNRSHGTYSQLLQGANRFRKVDWDTHYTRALELFQ